MGNIKQPYYPPDAVGVYEQGRLIRLFAEEQDRLLAENLRRIAEQGAGAAR